MAGSITQILTTLNVLQCLVCLCDQTEDIMQELLQQHEEQGSQEVTWLLEEMEQRSQKQTGLSQESMLLSACHHWCFWDSAKILILFETYWLPSQRISGYDSRSQGGTSSSSEEEREEEENDRYSTPSWSIEWICQKVIPTPMTKKVLSFFLSYDKLKSDSCFLRSLCTCSQS